MKFKGFTDQQLEELIKEQKTEKNCIKEKGLQCSREIL